MMSFIVGRLLFFIIIPPQRLIYEGLKKGGGRRVQMGWFELMSLS